MGFVPHNPLEDCGRFLATLAGIKHYYLLYLDMEISLEVVNISVDEPCQSCKGACCKFMPFGIPPRYQDEIDDLYQILPSDWADQENKYIRENIKTSDQPIDLRDCMYLTEGLCALQLAGHPKPRSCIEYEAGGVYCNKLRKKLGII